MVERGRKRLKSTIVLAAALTAALALSGCAGSTDEEASQEQADAEVEATPTPSSTPSQAPLLVSAITPSPSQLATPEPEPSQQAYHDQLLLEAVSKKVREYFTAPLENEYAVIFNKLEVETLIIMAVAADKRVMTENKESYPSFEELKPELLKYNSEQALEPWAYIYEKSTGWLLEPSDLLYAHRMVESSLVVTELESGQVKLEFKIYGHFKGTTPSSKLMTVTMLQEDRNWKVELIQAEPVAYAFSKEEVAAIMAKGLRGSEYQGEDEKYYYYSADHNDYVFDKENGYYALAMDVIVESAAP